MRYVLPLILLLPVGAASLPLLGGDHAGTAQPPAVAPDEAIGGVGATPFNVKSNGFTTDKQFAADQVRFSEQETPAEGLGPVFNNDSCRSCHNHPVTGGASIITELRVGKFDGTKFVEHPGGSLIQSRSLNPAVQERIISADWNLRGLRISISLLGDGFVEAIGNEAIAAVQAAQPLEMRGQRVEVPLLEAPGVLRTGRFGWKNQHASLLSFSVAAYAEEMGITSPLQPIENTVNGDSVAKFDTLAKTKPNNQGGPNGFGVDVEAFARFMRSLKVPTRDIALAATPSAQAGSALFDKIGCSICHTRQFTTLPTGTFINGDTLKIPAALGSKVIFPFSDFLLHDVGTGDGIVMNGPQSTAQKFRTTPLWGLRIKPRLGHDGLSFTRHEMILRHQGEAAGVTAQYRALSVLEQQSLHTFLRSL